MTRAGAVGTQVEQIMRRAAMGRGNVRRNLDYGRAIQTLRESAGLSRRELANLAGISYSFLSQIERGKKRPSAETGAGIARALNMKGSEFLRYVEELSPPAEDAPHVRSVQLPLKKSRTLALFSGVGQVQGGRAAAGDAPGHEGPHARRDLELGELQIIAKRLGDSDRQALLQLARHLMHRKQ